MIQVKVEVYINGAWHDVTNVVYGGITLTHPLFYHKGYGVADSIKLQVHDALFNNKNIWNQNIEFIRVTETDGTPDIYTFSYSSERDYTNITYCDTSLYPGLENIACTAINFTMKMTNLNPAKKNVEQTIIVNPAAYERLYAPLSERPKINDWMISFNFLENKFTLRLFTEISTPGEYFLLQGRPYHKDNGRIAGGDKGEFFGVLQDTIAVNSRGEKKKFNEYNYWYRTNTLRVNNFLLYNDINVNITPLFTGFYGLEKKIKRVSFQRQKTTLTPYDLSDIFNYVLDENHPRKLLSDDANKKDIYVATPYDLRSYKTSDMLLHIFNSDQSVEKGSGITFAEGIDDITAPKFSHDYTAGSFVIKKGDNVLEQVHKYLLQHNVFLSVQGDGTLHLLPLYDKKAVKKRIHATIDTVQIKYNNPPFTKIKLLYPSIKMKPLLWYKEPRLTRRELADETKYTPTYLNLFINRFPDSYIFPSINNRIIHIDFTSPKNIDLNLYSVQGAKKKITRVQGKKYQEYMYMVVQRKKNTLADLYPKEVVYGYNNTNINVGDIFENEEKKITYQDSHIPQYMRNSDFSVVDNPDTMQFLFQERIKVYFVDIALPGQGFFNASFIIRILIFHDKNENKYNVVVPYLFHDWFTDIQINGLPNPFAHTNNPEYPRIIQPIIYSEGYFDRTFCDIFSLPYNPTSSHVTEIDIRLYKSPTDEINPKNILSTFVFDITIPAKEGVQKYSDDMQLDVTIEKDKQTDFSYQGIPYKWKKCINTYSDFLISANIMSWDYYLPQNITAKETHVLNKDIITIDTPHKEKIKEIVYNGVYYHYTFEVSTGNYDARRLWSGLRRKNKRFMKFLFDTNYKIITFESMDDIKHNTTIAVLILEDTRPPLFDIQKNAMTTTSDKRKIRYEIIIIEKVHTYEEGIGSKYKYKGYIQKETEYINDIPVTYP